MQAIFRTTFADFRDSGQKIARRTLGPMAGTAIKLSDADDVAEGLAIGEGLERTKLCWRSRAVTRRLAANIAKLPELLRQPNP